MLIRVFSLDLGLDQIVDLDLSITDHIPLARTINSSIYYTKFYIPNAYPAFRDVEAKVLFDVSPHLTFTYICLGIDRGCCVFFRRGV